jgi:hypothetical protein
MRTSPAAARAFTDIDNGLSAVSSTNVVIWILKKEFASARRRDVSLRLTLLQHILEITY